MTNRTEMGGMQPPAQEHQGPPEAGGDKEQILPLEEAELGQHLDF